MYDYQLSPCGNPLGLLNDFCENPATLTYGTGTSFSASTAGTFTPDLASILDGYGSATGPFCGLVHNNSWYKFVAGNTTEVFRFTSTSCSGVQAQVYKVAYNVNGCCTSFSGKGNCLLQIPSPPQNNNTSIVTATGLVVGDEYMLMVDGYLGAECGFTIADWGAINVLPIELSEFRIIEFDDKNMLMWKTDSEINNDYFNVMRSFDGENFEIVGTVQGSGTSTTQVTYSLEDYDIRFGTMYYRLQQVDNDGKSTLSKILSINRRSEDTGLVAVYPNPTESTITMDINVSTQEGGLVTIDGVNGVRIFEKTIEGKGVCQLTFDMTDLRAGMYFVRYTDAEKSTVKSILKK